MVKAFFPEEEVISLAEEKASHFARADFPDGSSIVLDACETGEDPGSKREMDRRWYRLLSKRTGNTLSWGILLGVRPTKLAMQKRMEGWEAGAFLDWFQRTGGEDPGETGSGERIQSLYRDSLLPYSLQLLFFQFRGAFGLAGPGRRLSGRFVPGTGISGRPVRG